MADRARQITQMTRDLEYPKGAVLPLKRDQDNGHYECGFLYWGMGPRVYLANIFDIGPSQKYPRLADIPRFDFEEYSDVYDDGWRVD